jgi:hypothetical protein
MTIDVKGLRRDTLDIIKRGFQDIDTPDRSNTKFYENMISQMSDDKFVEWMLEFLQNDDENLYLEVDGDNEPDIRDIRRCAERLNIPLEYKLYYRHGVYADQPMPTMEPVIVGIVPVKMLQQTTPIKVKRGHSIDNRSTRTGQVTGKSKVAAISEPERNALIAIGADNVIKELTGPRADNQEAKNILYERIANGEPARLSELPNRPQDKTSMVTLNTYFIGACLESDILGNGLVLPKTVERIERDIIRNEESFTAEVLAEQCIEFTSTQLDDNFLDASIQYINDLLAQLHTTAKDAD